MLHITDYMDRGAFCFPDKLCMTGVGGDYTYKQAEAETHAVQHALADAGFTRGNIMSILSPNDARVLLAQMGAIRGGVIWCNLNARNATKTNTDILTSNGVEMLFFHSTYAEQAEQVFQEIESLTYMVCLDQPSGRWPGLEDFISPHRVKGPAPRPDLQYDATALQVHTGGTTGLPKITEQSNRMISVMMMAFSTVFRFDKPPVNLVAAPMTHAAGPIAIAHMAHGGLNVIVDNAHLDTVIAAVEKYKVTTLFLPPTVTYALLANENIDKWDFSSLKYWVSTSAPILPEKMAEVVRHFGPVMMNIYGQTEAGFPITCLLPHEVEEAVNNPDKAYLLKSCGRPTLFSQVTIVDEEGIECPPGEFGEIVSRGENLVNGFLNDSAATAETRLDNGYQRTGDIGYRDAEGYIYVTDRKRDLIISGGFNIFPIEIESCIVEHPAIQDCAVIGVADDKWGEAIKAVIQLKSGKTADEDEIKAFCREKIGGLKTPKSVDFWDELPKSPVGKVMKKDIREFYWKDCDRKI